jgi:hypothetical protein
MNTSVKSASNGSSPSSSGLRKMLNKNYKYIVDKLGAPHNCTILTEIQLEYAREHLPAGLV